MDQLNKFNSMKNVRSAGSSTIINLIIDISSDGSRVINTWLLYMYVYYSQKRDIGICVHLFGTTDWKIFLKYLDVLPCFLAFWFARGANQSNVQSWGTDELLRLFRFMWCAI